jgi:hypothetical protein
MDYAPPLIAWKDGLPGHLAQSLMEVVAMAQMKPGLLACF